MRASALAQVVGEMAGYAVNIPGARMLWFVNPHAVIVESDSSMGPRWRDRNRVLVLLQRGKSLAIPSRPIAIGPVTIVGVARTLLGVQAGHDVPWPEALTPRELDVRGAILATSVRTADGVDLTLAAPEP
jgi:hypothetical protein